MTDNIPISIACGDGIGPAITDAALCVLRDAGAKVHIDFVEIGLRAFHYGFALGIPKSCMETILRNRVLLKAPTITPDGTRHKLPVLGDEQVSFYRPDVSVIGIAPQVVPRSMTTANSECVVFEPDCDALPDIAYSDDINPTGMINAAALMLTYIGQEQAGRNIGNALLKTLEEGIHTADIYDASYSREKVNTAEFTAAVSERLGQAPKKLPRFMPYGT